MCLSSRDQPDGSDPAGRGHRPTAALCLLRLESGFGGSPGDLSGDLLVLTGRLVGEDMLDGGGEGQVGRSCHLLIQELPP